MKELLITEKDLELLFKEKAPAIFYQLENIVNQRTVYNEDYAQENDPEFDRYIRLRKAGENQSFEQFLKNRTFI